VPCLFLLLHFPAPVLNPLLGALLGLARGAVLDRVGTGGRRAGGVELGLLLDVLVGVRREEPDIGAVVRLVAPPGRLVWPGE